MRAGLVALVTSLNVAGMGADYPNDQPEPGLETWPVGLSRMINATNRVHGFFINAEDTFFFSGTATNFTSFLQDYAKLPGVADRRLIIHEGVDTAASPWEKTSRPCDWKLTACPVTWARLKNGAARAAESQPAENSRGYTVEVHLWSGGRIDWKQLTVPAGVVVVKAK